VTLTFSAVTPSFNQRRFLPVCIESVHAQTRLPIEHIVVDPGSTDGSLDYLAHDDRLTLIVGEDDGQADAVNIGVRRASGDVIAWLNSDDAYHGSDVFARVGAIFDKHPDVDIVYGEGSYIDERGAILRKLYINPDPSSLRYKIATEVGIAQPACFFRRRLFDEIGALDPQRSLAMDYELWMRAIRAGKRFHYIDAKLAKTRVHGETKTFGSRWESFREVADIVSEHFGYLPLAWAERWSKATVTASDGIIDDPDRADLDAAAQDQINDETTRILQAYNAGPLRQSRLKQIARSRGGEAAATTLSFMERVDSSPVAELPMLTNHQLDAPSTIRPVLGMSYHFPEQFQNNHARASRALIDRIREGAPSHAVVLGNGPSLRSVRAEHLDGAFVLGANYLHLNKELWPEVDLVSISNPLVAEQRRGRLNLIDDVILAFPWWLAAYLRPRANTMLLPADGDISFSPDVAERISWCHTVTYFNLQIAFSLGFTKVTMAGFDHSYSQPSNAVEGDTLVQEAPDSNHFDPSYFQGKRWHAADVDGMEATYVLARNAFEQAGRTIVNGTDGGHLEVFERELLGGPRSASSSSVATS